MVGLSSFGDRSRSKYVSNGFTTTVPQPYFGPLGIVLPTEDDVLTGVQTDIDSALGGNVNPQLSSPQGQIASTETAVIGDSLAQFAWFCNQVDPALNSGRMQDAIGRIYFMTRIAAQPTVQPCICTGLNTTQISVNALAQDPNTGLLWICQEAGQIGVSGSVTLDFACTTFGPVSAPASLTIYQQISGWENIAPTGPAVLGNNVETPAQFEARRRASVAANAVQIMDSIQGTVLALPGVLDCFCYENDQNLIVTVGGVQLGPNSIYVCVLGGSQSAIAFAIWTKKGPGAGYNGNTFTTVTDPNPAYNPPAPQYSVGYTTATVVAFAVLVTLSNNSGIPSNALSLIQQSVIAAFAGLDNGPRAKIGSLVLASRYYSGVAVLGSWAQIVDITLGKIGSGASFTGSIAGTVLTVTVIPSGHLAPGQVLNDAGLLANATLIVAQLTGPSGGVGTYRVSVLQTVASEPMTATNLVNDIQMLINQAPAVSAGNIGLVLQ
jgi:hypothetical protein